MEPPPLVFLFSIFSNNLYTIDADLNLGFGEEMAPAFPNYGFNIANEMGFQRRYVYPRGISQPS